MEVIFYEKKAILAVFAVITVALFIGCKNKDGDTLSRRNNVSENESAGNTGISDTQVQNPGEYPNPMIKYVGSIENFPPSAFPVDIDFTVLSGTEFDEEFANVMIMYPNDYLGKTLRFVGQYSNIFDENDNSYKHFVVFDDPKGCCIRFVEFAWYDGFAPDSFPEKFAVVDVAGVFTSYFDKTVEWDFHFLKVNSIAVLTGEKS